jgi:hypothetical protein
MFMLLMIPYDTIPFFIDLVNHLKNIYELDNQLFSKLNNKLYLNYE